MVQSPEECAYDYLVDSGIATAEEVALVTSINGDNIETYESVLFVRTGYRSFDQLDNEDQHESKLPQPKERNHEHYSPGNCGIQANGIRP